MWSMPAAPRGSHNGMPATTITLSSTAMDPPARLVQLFASGYCER